VKPGVVAMAPPQKISENFMQNNVFLCKIFTSFNMHPVNSRNGGLPPPLNPPLQPMVSAVMP